MDHSQRVDGQVRRVGGYVWRVGGYVWRVDDRSCILADRSHQPLTGAVAGGIRNG